jgi:hypothetical protein
LAFTLFVLVHTNRAGWTLHPCPTRDADALINALSDLIRATVLLIMVPKTRTSSPGRLIASTRTLIDLPSDLTRATTSLMTPAWSLITTPRSLITRLRSLITTPGSLITLACAWTWCPHAA